MLLHIPIETALGQRAKARKGTTTWEVYVGTLIARDLEGAIPGASTTGATVPVSTPEGAPISTSGVLPPPPSLPHEDRPQAPDRG
jgi:hypothetical protein